MRWSIIRLIWFRELRDQLRDRRTLFTILLLPLLLYPLLSVLLMQFATQLLDQTSIIGLVSAKPELKNFPQPLPPATAQSPVPPLAWLSLTPLGPATPVDKIVGAATLYQASQRALDYLPLFENGEIPEIYRQPPKGQVPIFPGTIQFKYEFIAGGEADAALREKTVDLLVAAPDDFLEQLISGGRPKLEIKGRPNDDRSRRAWEQFSILLGRWKTHLKEVRFHRQGLPTEFDSPFAVDNKLMPESAEVLAAASLLDMLVRTFPFMLVMWSLAGALYPAIDLCAGEKERGTMETLLISPAGREEIVLGKFLTIWVFSAVTATMHLLSMSIATWQLRSYLPQAAVTLQVLFWCIVLVLPLSAFFSAVSLAVGAYARSSKEGQYYLMPLFWLTMPLVFLTLAPGVDLNSFYSMVPVTGVALLMQDLMRAPSLDRVQWFYFLPVFATVILYSWLALRWAIAQFQREEVLFREAERLDLFLWLKRLFRDKEALPTPGQALFCFALLFALRWFSLNLGGDLPLLARNAVTQVAFVATPPLFMAFLLTTRPRRSLALNLPNHGFALAALLLLPLGELVLYILHQVPRLVQELHGRRSFVEQAYNMSVQSSSGSNWLLYALALSLPLAMCKELAFRGFIQTGLRRFGDWPAIFLSSFLFAAFHMNVFALAPLFVLGVALGWLALRSGSLLPGMILHTGCGMLLLSGPLGVMGWLTADWSAEVLLTFLLLMALICSTLAGYLLVRLPVGRIGAK